MNDIQLLAQKLQALIGSPPSEMSRLERDLALSYLREMYEQLAQLEIPVPSRPATEHLTHASPAPPQAQTAPLDATRIQPPVNPPSASAPTPAGTSPGPAKEARIDPPKPANFDLDSTVILEKREAPAPPPKATADTNHHLRDSVLDRTQQLNQARRAFEERDAQPDVAIHEKFDKEPVLGEKLKFEPLEDLRKIDLNDRFWYIRELFENQSEAYQSAIQSFERCHDHSEAVEQFNQLHEKRGWKQGDTAVRKFRTLIDRRFA